MQTAAALSVMPAAITRRLIRRGALYWLLVRLMVLMTGGKIALGIPSVAGMIAVAVVAGFLAYSELGFFRERTLAANLGVWHGWYGLLPAVASLTIDTVLGTFLSALRVLT